MPKIINTNKSKCVACNKCIMVCPVKYANKVEIIDGERKVEVDPTRCIGCGKCLEVCDHKARYYVDDTQRFFQDLKNGKNISVIAAPSFSLGRKINHKKFFGYLKSLGVNLIYDVSYGADITSWAYVKYIKVNGANSLISQPCPSIVNYIERYAPELIENLIPINSPVQNTSIYLKKYLNNNDNIAFISPCIAKKIEFTNNRSKLINYNVTYNQIWNYLLENNINLDKYKEVDFENEQPGLGSQYSKPGGLKDNLNYHLPDLSIKQLEGTPNVYEFISMLKDKDYLSKYDFIDILNCGDGCNLGTGTSKRFYPNKIETELRKEKFLENQNKKELDEKHYKKLFEYFDKKLNFDDFLTSYKDKTDNVLITEPSKDDLDKAFEILHKTTEESKKINCQSCGYKTCKDMAIAIYNNYNVPSSCYQFTKKELELKQNSLANKNTELSSLLKKLHLLSEEKHQKEKYIRAVLAHLTESVIITDQEGMIKFTNNKTENIFNHPIKYYEGRYIQEIIPEIDIAKVNKNDSYIGEFNFSSDINKTSTIRLESTFLSLNNEKILIFIIDDITKEKELDSLNNQFVSVISHELRTPLTSVRGAIGLLASESLGKIPKKASDLLNIANNNCIRLINLINDLLDLEKIKAGKMNFEFDEYEIISLVEEAVSLNLEYAKEFNVKFKIIKNIDNSTIRVDRGRFIQIMTNLLSNAAKFSPKGETVNITLEKEGELVKVLVVDKGAGVPKEHYKTIFESFAQIGSSYSKQKGGTGLGLTITKSIVNKMGGKISFYSKQNEGATFFFTLPVVHKKIKNKKALIHEKDNSTATSIQKTLKSFHYDAEIVKSEEAALELLSKNNYSLVTTDIEYPKTKKQNILKKIRTNPKTKDLPVIVVSAHKKYDLGIEIQDKITDWIEKSFDPKKVSRVIQNVFQNKNEEKIKVLHVEDDQDLLEVASTLLDEIASVNKAISLKQAKENLLLYKFDLIILDYKLPDGTCEEIISEIQKSSSKNAKIVVFSGYEISKDISAQVDSTIYKTKVSNEEFISSIKNLAEENSYIAL